MIRTPSYLYFRSQKAEMKKAKNKHNHLGGNKGVATGQRARRGTEGNGATRNALNPSPSPLARGQPLTLSLGLCFFLVTFDRPCSTHNSSNR